MSAWWLALSVFVLIAAAAPAAAWRDDFDARKLAERWTWHVPARGPTLSLNTHPGWLRLAVPQTPTGFNHWEGIQRAALLKTAAPKGDWLLTARVTLSDWKPDSNLHLALVVGFAPDRVLAWGPFLSKALYPDQTGPTVWAEPTGHGAYLRTSVRPTDVELRIAKLTNTYRLYTRRSGQTRWTEHGCWYGGGLSPQFVGLMGKSFGPNPAGALDVDYVELLPVHPAPAPAPVKATVTVGQATGRRVPPLQRGFFLEFLGRCIFQGIWDERLDNRKLIGPDTPSGIVWRWEPFGKAKGFAPDRAQPYAEPQSQRIELASAEGGIAQGDLTLGKGVAYAVRVVVKGEGVRTVRVALGDGRGVQAERSFKLEGADWQTHACTLAATRSTAKGRLVVAAKGPGRLWLGAASLMRADNAGGFRRDLLEVTRRAQVPTFRWPGGNMASGYHWRDGIGPQDRRPTRWDRAWNAWVYNDMGTDEFIAYCRLLGAEPCICVNAGEGTAAEAAAWVGYCNGPADSPMGRLRAANGHPEPFGVKYWDIGNEIWGRWQLGHTSPEDYGLRAVEFARAMRQADPDIVLVASGVLDDGFDRWNRRMLPICGPVVDMLSVHDYTRYDARRCSEADWAKVVGAPLRLERSLRNTVRIAQQAAGKRLPLTFDEWNAVPGRAGVPHGLPEALYAAGVLHAMQRCGDDVPIGNYALLVNVIGALRTTPTEVVETPVFLAFRLLADHSGPLDVRVEAECPTFHRIPAVDVAATLSADKATLHITAVNRHPRRAAAVAWRLGTLAPSGDVRVTTLTGPEPWARNTPRAPRTVCLSTETIAWPEAARRPLPAASVVGYSLRIR